MTHTVGQSGSRPTVGKVGRMESVDEEFPRLLFRYPFDELTAWETVNKGWTAIVTVELADGLQYPVFFYDPVRLAQDLETKSTSGCPFIAERGMIVVPEITEATMRLAVKALYKQGWFEHQHPLNPSGDIDITEGAASQSQTQSRPY